MGDIIRWEPPPYGDDPKGLSMDLLPTLWKVMFEEGFLTWEEYAAKVKFEHRPMHLRHKPSALPDLKPEHIRRRAFRQPEDDPPTVD